MNIKKIVTIAAAAAVSVPMLAACGGNTGTSNSDVSKYEGHWNIKSLEAGGEALDVQALFSATGGNTENIGLDLEKDGKLTLMLYGDDANKGTWKESGNDTLILTVSGDDQEAVIRNGLLEMSMGEGEGKLTILFEKEGSEGAVTETTESDSSTTEESTTEEITTEETTPAS